MTSFTIHPAAAIFPMMSEGELAELAADIKANGLIHPIVLDASGKILIDGRNRMAACEIAEVEPQFERLNGQDPAAFIVAANLQRRNLTKGQAAMAMAMIYPEPAKTAPGRKAPATGSATEPVSKERLSVARAVLRLAPDLAPLVIAGKSLDEAHRDALARQAGRDTEVTRMAELHAKAADLAELVVEERLSLAEAWNTHQQRIEEAKRAEQNKRETLLRMAEALYRGGTAFASDGFVSSVRDRLGDDEFRSALIDRLRVDGGLDEIRIGAEALITILREVIDG